MNSLIKKYISLALIFMTIGFIYAADDISMEESPREYTNSGYRNRRSTSRHKRRGINSAENRPMEERPDKFGAEESDYASLNPEGTEEGDSN